LKEKIGEQKIVLEQILVVLEIYKTKANFSTLINDLKELQKIYSGVEMKTVMGKTKTIERNGELVVETDTQTIVNISDTDVEKITSLVKSIRNKIVK
jgi:biotin-(acetyl-CoA carboxylase) ligase